VDRRGKPGIAAASAPSTCDDDALVRAGEVINFFSGLIVVDDGSDWHFQKYVRTLAASFIRTFTVPSTLGFVFGIEAEVDQGIVALTGLHDDVAALTAVATRGAAARDKLLATKGHAAVPAVAGFDSYFGLIDKHKRSLRIRRRGAIRSEFLIGRNEPIGVNDGFWLRRNWLA
jgi:hypothetical protein